MGIFNPEVANIIKAFVGTEGEIVWILRIFAREQNKALVQIRHIDHLLNDEVLLCSVLKTEEGKRYVCTFNGDSYVLLSMEHGSGMLYLPDDMAFQVTFSAELTSKGEPQQLVNVFMEQSSKKLS